MVLGFIARTINKILNAIITEIPDAEPKVPYPYVSQHAASVGLMETHAAEFNTIAQGHLIQGHGIKFNDKTGDPEYHIFLNKGDKSNIRDIPKNFRDGLPIVVEYRGIAKG